MQKTQWISYILLVCNIFKNSIFLTKITNLNKNPSSHILRPRHPISRASHISNIPHLQHLISWITHIQNIQNSKHVLHPEHSIFQTFHIPNILHPNIPHPKHPTYQTSYIPNVSQPKHFIFRAWKLHKQRTSKKKVYEITFFVVNKMHPQNK